MGVRQRRFLEVFSIRGHMWLAMKQPQDLWLVRRLNMAEVLNIVTLLHSGCRIPVGFCQDQQWCAGTTLPIFDIIVQISLHDHNIGLWGSNRSALLYSAFVVAWWTRALTARSIEKPHFFRGAWQDDVDFLLRMCSCDVRIIFGYPWIFKTHCDLIIQALILRLQDW